MKNRRSLKASALIFTLLIIGLVASLSFFVSRSAVREARVTSAGASSLGAYYAAEAGLEDGLARLAADKNIEVPTCAWRKYHTNNSTNTSPCDASDASGAFNNNLSIADLALATPQSFASRVLMAKYGPQGASTINQTSNGSLNKVIDYKAAANDPASNPNDFVYDLRITSRIQCLGPINVACSTNPADPGSGTDTLIKKDSVKEVNVYSGVGNTEAPTSARIFWQCNNSSSVPPNTCNFTDNLIVTLVYSCPSGTPADQECTTDQVQFSNSSNAVKSISINNANNTLVKMRFKPVSTDTTMSGVNLSLVFGDSAGKLVYFKGDVARLQSIGYFAGIKRRLEATVDRNSGALLGLFDYAVYAGTNFLQP